MYCWRYKSWLRAERFQSLLSGWAEIIFEGCFKVNSYIHIPDKTKVSTEIQNWKWKIQIQIVLFILWGGHVWKEWE